MMFPSESQTSRSLSTTEEWLSVLARFSGRCGGAAMVLVYEREGQDVGVADKEGGARVVTDACC